MVVFRIADGHKAQQAVLPRVAFEVDSWDPDSRVGWSVVLKGVAQEVTTGIDPFAAAPDSQEPEAPNSTLVPILTSVDRRF